jgi:hypothetical protein
VISNVFSLTDAATPNSLEKTVGAAVVEAKVDKNSTRLQ